MNNLNNITQDWTHADQFLNDKIDKNNDSIKHDFSELTSDINTRFTDIENEVKILNGVAEDQFITDSAAEMTKVVPDGVNKGIVSMIGGKTQKVIQLVRGIKSNISIPGITITFNNGVVSISGKANAVVNEEMLFPIDFISGRKYACLGGKILLGTNNTASMVVSGAVTEASTYLREDKVITATATVYSSIRLVVQDTSTTINDSFTPMVFDLTAMFGAGKEPTIEQFKAMYTESYYPPTDGSLYNAPIEKVVLSGANLFNINGEVNMNYLGLVSDSVNTVSDGVLTCGKNATSQQLTGQLIPTIPGNTYTLTVENISNGSGNGVYIRVYGSIGSTNNLVTKSVAVNTTESVSFTAIENNTLIGFGTLGGTGAKITKIQVEYINKTILLLDKIVDKLPDYGCSVGDVYNYIDFEEMKYHHRVGSVDLNKLNFESYVWSSQKLFKSNKIDIIKVTSSTDYVPNMVCSTYDSVKGNDLLIYDKTIAIGNGHDNSIYIRDDKYDTNVDNFKSSLNNAIVNFELKTEELIDISDLLLPFKCEPGGTITFKNEHNIDVPNTVIYEKEMK